MATDGKKKLGGSYSCGLSIAIPAVTDIEMNSLKHWSLF